MFFPMCDNNNDVFSMFSKGTNEEDSKQKAHKIVTYRLGLHQIEVQRHLR